MAYLNKKPVDADENGLFLYFMEREDAKDQDGVPRERAIFLDEENDDTIVMKGLPHPDEYVFGEFPRNIERILALRDTKVYASYEGTSIHIFYHKGQWYTSTHKKLDAFKSYWADNTNKFGASFARGLMGVLKGDVDGEYETEEELKAFLVKVYNKYLNKDLKYTFILPPIASERVGSRPKARWPQPVNVMVRNSEFVVLEDHVTFPGVFYPIVQTNKRIDVFMAKVASSDPDYWQGLYVRFPGSPLQIKVYSRQYYGRMTIRANTANLKFRYMFVRSNRQQWDMFVNTYTEFDWRAVEDEMRDACMDVEALWAYEDTSIPRFDIKDVCDILERKQVTCTFKNLMQLSYTAPLKFNKLLNKRRKANNKMQKMITEEIEKMKKEEMEENDDLLAKMNVLDDFE